MYIVQISPECAPVVKIGGLGDVVFGLSKELENRGNQVEIILPKYDCMRYDQIWDLNIVFHDLWVPWYDGAIHCSVWSGFVHGRKCYFIDPHSNDNFFNRGTYYGCDDDVMRYAFFSKAALEFLLQSGKQPDIIHCHDWHTGLVPVMLYELYRHTCLHNSRVCYTIHNFKHQGLHGEELLWATGLGRPEYFFHYDRLRDNFNPFGLNIMKGGIVYSNFINTVSPTHALEAINTEHGYGLAHTLQIHRHKFGGILNGVDYETWNPEYDGHLDGNYNAHDVDKKYWNKGALRNRLMMRQDFKPLIAYVGRLDSQKGVDLIRHAIYHTISNNAQFVLLGSSPDPSINQMFWDMKHELNDNPDCHLELGFNEELARMIYAGADMIIVPSNFEPCGLTQLIGMKYGTVPIVRAVGGLADTVFDKDYAHDKALHERNGFVFYDADIYAIESTLDRAISLWYNHPEHFRELMLNGMRQEQYSWHLPAQYYANVFEYIRH